MSLDNLHQVDAVGIDRESGAVVLTITDYWDWTNERQHLVALQEKLNAYFRFVESGQMFESYPQARGKALMILIVGAHVLPPAAEQLVGRASQVAEPLGLAIKTRHYPGSVGTQ